MSRVSKTIILTEGRAAVLGALLLASLSCSNAGKIKGGNNEEKPQSTAPQGAIDDKDQLMKGIPIARAVYQVKVNGNSGIELCKGLVEVILSTNFSMKPQGTITCKFNLTLDAGELFGQVPEYEFQKFDEKALPGYGYLVRMPNPTALQPGLAQFNPPRPSILGPIVQSPERFNRFVLSEKSTVKGVSLKGEPYQSQGSFFIKVWETGKTFRPDTYEGSDQFNSIIRWEIKAAGWDGAPKGEAMLFDSMEYYYNIRPIAVPKLIIKAKFADIAPPEASAIGGIADALFSGVTIEISLVTHTPIGAN